MHYLDHNATSPIRPEVRAVMLAAWDVGGNPSSVHAAGRASRAVVEKARAQVARLAHVPADSVIFTGGGTESLWLALNGAVYGALEAEARITRLFISAIEHDAVRANAHALAERVAGLRVENIPVTRDGTVGVDALRGLLRQGKGRALVAVMAANNETGVIQPIAEISAIAREFDALLAMDAVQAAGKLEMERSSPHVDYVALSAHKLGGPLGVGALAIREGVPFAAQFLGGGQEMRRRSGTQNVPGIAGFGAAAELVVDNARLTALRDKFEMGLKEIAPEGVIFGCDVPRLANTSCFALPGVSAETALMALDLDGVMVSSGSACSSGKVARSHVLDAMGVDEALSRCAMRVSLGWNSDEADIDACLAALKTLAARTHARVAA